MLWRFKLMTEVRFFSSKRARIVCLYLALYVLTRKTLGVSVEDAIVTVSYRWISSGYTGFLPHEDHRNANIGANERE